MNYKSVCVHSKGALVVLATSMLLISTTTISGGLSANFIDNYLYAIFATIGLHYLSYPLLGLLGEKWMRYKVILVGIILMFVGFLIAMVITIQFMHLNGIVVVSICLVTTFPYFLGYGIFAANVIQFGTDQFQFASSQELNSFVYWVLYINYSLLALILLMTSSITGIVYKDTIYLTFTCIFGYGVIIVIIAVLFFVVSNITLLLSQLNITILSN